MGTVFPSQQLLRRVPEAFFEVNYLVLRHFDTLFFEGPLHSGGSFEMMFAREQPFAVHYTVGGNVFLRMSSIHCPAHHPRTHFCAEVLGDSTVACYPAFRD